MTRVALFIEIKGVSALAQLSKHKGRREQEEIKEGESRKK
jgi:hypothetical protein